MKQVIVFMTMLLFLSPAAFAEDNCGQCHKTKPSGEIGDTCKNCHPVPTQELQLGSMKFLSCTACHGEEHHGPNTGNSKPGFAAFSSCVPCHQNETNKYKAGKHYQAWPALTAIKAYNTIYPKKASDKGCVPCHRIGQEWPDGTRGRCNFCHTQHVFSKAAAAKPEACRMCHAGDQPQYDAWANSMHGAVYESEGGRAPTCVTCHGGHEVITAWGFLGLRGEGGNEDADWKKAQEVIREAMDVIGLTDSPKAVHTYAEWQKLRGKMMERCKNCHVDEFVQNEMKKSDDFLRELDLAEEPIINTISGLYNNKLIDDKTRMALYYDAIILRIGSFIGSYHNAPSQAWDHGYFRLYPESFLAQKVSEFDKKFSQTMTMIIAIIVVVLSAIIICFIILFLRRKKSRQVES